MDSTFHRAMKVYAGWPSNKDLIDKTKCAIGGNYYAMHPQILHPSEITRDLVNEKRSLGTFDPRYFFIFCLFTYLHIVTA